MDQDDQARCVLHAPKTPAEIQAAAHRLLSQGFSDHTISSILKLDVNSVRTMLGERRA